MRKIFVLTTALFLSGCFGGMSPQSTFYTLKPMAQEAVSSRALSVAVEPVKIPAMIDRPQIVTMQSNGITLHFSETNRWAENLSTLLQRTLVGDLVVLMPKSSVQVKMFSREGVDYTVYLNVTQLDGVLGNQAILKAHWTLLDKNGKTVFQSSADLKAPVGENYDDFVLTQSNLLAELAEKIAQKLANVKK